MILLAGCARQSPIEKGSAPQTPYVLSATDKKEEDLGNQIHEEILSTFYLYTEPNAIQYVNDISERLTRHAKRDHLPYAVTLLVSDKIFATSAPGGHIYITTGFINLLDNEAELAAVLAHEIGQLQYQNPQFSRKKMVVKKIGKTGAVVGSFLGQIGAPAVLGFAAMDAMTEPKTVEKRVIMADRLALQYLREAHYDPQGLIDVLYKITGAEKTKAFLIFDYYMARPISEERFKKIRKDFKKLDLKDGAFETRRPEFLEATKGIREMYRIASPAV